MDIASACPDQTAIEQLLGGVTPEPVAEELERHLAGCPRCLNAVRGHEADDALLSTVRRVARDGRRPWSAEPALIERLCRSGPPFVPTNQLTQRLPGAATPVVPDAEATLEATECLLPPQAPGQIGRFANFIVRQVLGAGGMGVVFLAEDPQLGRPVALKVLRVALAGRASARMRFLCEARATAAIQSDHVVELFQVGEDRGLPYLSMELLQGESLAARSNRQPRLTLGEIVRIGRETAEGLAAVHAAGVVHGDVKPANLWLQEQPAVAGQRARDSWRVKIHDFGLARSIAAQPAGRVTVAGTPAYAAPEQMRGETFDERADLFSLGVVLHELCTGRRPTPLAHDATTTGGRIEQLSALPAPLATLIHRLLRARPAERPGSAREVADELAAIENSPRRPSRHRVLVACALVALVALFAALLCGPLLLRVTDPSGKRTTTTLPPGSKVVIEKDGQVIAETPGATSSDVLGQLDPARLKESERYAWQPKELVAVLGKHRQRHWGEIEAVVISPDGRTIASSGTDHVIRLWDTATLRETSVLAGHDGIVHAVAFAPDGRTLASAGSDRTVRLWDLTGDAPRERAVIRGSAGSVRRIAFAADGKTLASCGEEPVVRLWDLAGAEPRAGVVVADLPKNASAVNFERDGRLLAIAFGNVVRLYDVATPQPRMLAELPAFAARVLDVRFRPTGGRQLAVVDGTQMQLWDVSRAAPRSHFVAATPGRALAWSADGKSLVTAGISPDLQLWDMTGAEPRPSGQLKGSTQANSSVALARTPSGAEIAVAGGPDRCVRVWDVAGGIGQERGGPVGHLGEIRALAVSPDGKLLASGDHTGLILLHDLAAAPPGEQPATLMRRGYPVLALAFAPQGRVLAAGSFDSTLRIWDLASARPREVAAIVRDGEAVMALAFSPDGRLLASGHSDRAARLWDMTASPPKEERVLRTTGNGVGALAFTPDGRRLATAGPDDLMRLWNLEKTNEPFFSAPGGWSVLAFARDGTMANEQESSVNLWDLSGPVPRRRANLAGHGAPICSAAFAPDGRSIVVTEDDGHVTWWDISAQKPLRSWRLPGATRAAFLPGPAAGPWRLALANANGTIYILRLAPLSANRPDPVP